ncbi:MAG TPA: adenylosuccinate lyase, partial [Bacteroidetes bacterium]|nr:adenylosuccinate lyase [Bacteroidota bacterium]
LYYMLVKMINLVKNLLVYPETMQYNIDKMRGLVFSQAILLELAKKSVSREEAYQWVQRNAMEVWREENATLKKLILSDEDIKKVLTEDELKSCFDIQRHLEHVDFIFKRVGLE